MTGYKSKRAAAQDKLAQPAQEPIKQVLDAEFNRGYKEGVRDAYAKPPQRPWVDLTDEEIKAVNAQVSQIPPIDYTTTTYARAVEAKLKEKNT